MNRLRVTFFISMLTLFMLPAVVSAQSSDNSIEASWERAETPPPQKQQVQSAAQPLRQSEGLKYQKTAWGSKQSESSRPWPKLTSTSSAKEYFDANNAVIDSLASLYCLSTNYVSTLRIRNQQSMQGRDSQLRDFNYEGGQQPALPPSARTSVQALHKELMQLLERCLIGR